MYIEFTWRNYGSQLQLVFTSHLRLHALTSDIKQQRERDRDRERQLNVATKWNMWNYYFSFLVKWKMCDFFLSYLTVYLCISSLESYCSHNKKTRTVLKFSHPNQPKDYMLLDQLTFIEHTRFLYSSIHVSPINYYVD
jgi:hypothetical protein